VRRIAAWIFLAAALIVAVGGVVFGPWDHDGGAYLLRGAYVAEGLRPYINYPSIYLPLVDLLTAAVAWLPFRLAIAILLPIAWIFAICAATVVLGHIITHDLESSLFLGGFYALFATANGGNHLTLEHGVALFGVLAFAAAFGGRLPLAAFFAACATLSKQNGVLVFLPLIPLVTRRDAGRMIAAAAIPFLLVAIWIRDLPALFHSCVSELITYSRQPALSPPLSTEFVRSPETVILFAIVIVAVFVARSRAVAWTALICAILELMPRLVRNYPHYTINIWPFIALILSLAMPRMRVLFNTFALIALVLVLGRSQWQTPSRLLTVFKAAADRVAEVTPPNEPVRQYGAEPIIEFLANRNEDVINKRVEAVFGPRWDGSNMYSAPPSPSTTVVIIDRGQPWIRDVFRDVRSRGFVVVGQFGRIWIFRTRPTPPARPAAPR